MEHPDAPRRPHLVRLDLERTVWEITSLPGGHTKMALRIEVPVSSTFGVPKWILNWFQRQSLRELVENLVAGTKRLRLPVDERVISWGRSRDEVKAARARARKTPANAALHRIASGSWLVLVGSVCSSCWGSVASSLIPLVAVATDIHDRALVELERLFGLLLFL